MKFHKHSHIISLLLYCLIISSCGKPDYSYTYTNWETHINGKVRSGGTREYEKPPVKCKIPFLDIEYYEPVNISYDESESVELDDIEYFLESAEKQKKGVWCWAACLQSILRFKGINISQEQIVFNIHKSVSGSLDEGGDLYDMLKTIEDLWYHGEDLFLTDVYRSFNGDPITFIVNNLEENQPVLCGFFDGSSSKYGHVGVITGIDFVVNGEFAQIINLTIWDPLIGTSLKKLSCENFKNLVEFLVAIY